MESDPSNTEATLSSERSSRSQNEVIPRSGRRALAIAIRELFEEGPVRGNTILMRYFTLDAQQVRENVAHPNRHIGYCIEITYGFLLAILESDSEIPEEMRPAVLLLLYGIKQFNGDYKEVLKQSMDAPDVKSGTTNGPKID